MRVGPLLRPARNSGGHHAPLALPAVAQEEPPAGEAPAVDTAAQALGIDVEAVLPTELGGQPWTRFEIRRGQDIMAAAIVSARARPVAGSGWPNA